MDIFKLLTPVPYWLLIVMWIFILIFFLRRILQSKTELEERVRIRAEDLDKSNRELEKETALRTKTSRMLQGIFDGITDPLVLLEKDLMVKNLNASAKAYYNIEGDRVIGKPCYNAFRGKQAVCDGCEIPAAIQEGKAVILERKPAHQPDRHERISIYPVKDENGEVEATLMRIHDITERKMLEKQLIQSEKLAAIGILVSGIAHEINNPNNFVIFNMPILKDYMNEIIPIMDRYADEHPGLEMFYMPYQEFRDDIFKLIENVEHGARRIKTIVSDLKDFSRIRTPKNIETMDIHPIFEKVVAFSRSKIQQTVKTFTIDIPAHLPHILVDPQALEQVLINLLINASQAFGPNLPSDYDTQVALRVSVKEASSKEVVIEVIDNGRGMDERTQDRIFDPFFTTKTATEGTGLGLYISHNLIENMGGRIEVESELGRGSVFRVVLKG